MHEDTRGASNSQGSTNAQGATGICKIYGWEWKMLQETKMDRHLIAC